MKKGDFILTLCRQCGEVFSEDSRLTRVGFEKCPCDICTRWGYDYKITRREHYGTKKAMDKSKGN